MLRQTWTRLAFVHWEIDARWVQERLPPGLTVDTWGSKAWLALVPFQMHGIAPRGLPPLPGLSAFPEINLRTYVTDGRKPGIWFYSLDIDKTLPAWLAQTLFALPYRVARIAAENHPSAVRYRETLGAQNLDATFRAGARLSAPAGSFAQWSTERYCLYTARPEPGTNPIDGQWRPNTLRRLEVHHPFWPLRRADVEFTANTMTANLHHPGDRRFPTAFPPFLSIRCRSAPVS